MKVKVYSCICIWFVNVFMGIKMANLVPLTAGCSIFTVNMGITMWCLFSRRDAHIHRKYRHWDAHIHVNISIGCLYLREKLMGIRFSGVPIFTWHRWLDTRAPRIIDLGPFPYLIALRGQLTMSYGGGRRVYHRKYYFQESRIANFLRKKPRRNYQDSRGRRCKTTVNSKDDEPTRESAYLVTR